MKRAVLIVTATILILLFTILWLSEMGRNPEPGGGEINISAEAVDNERVRLSITMTRWGFSPSFPPLENIKVFATVENSENALVGITWTGPIKVTREGLSGERVDGDGVYKYGTNPKGKEIEVRMFLYEEGYWKIRIS